MTETTPPSGKVGRWRFFRRGPWENVAVTVIGCGVFMLMQPFSLWLYGHSFTVILVGTLGFVIVSHFPQDGDNGHG